MLVLIKNITVKHEKIIVINDYGFNSGGASVVAIQTAIGLKKLGFDVTFFVCLCPH